MIRKKVCMLGAVSVGKTSLVRQFVDSMFDARYQQTIGVKIDKKLVSIAGQDVTLMLWDIHGESDQMPVKEAYLRGMDGYLLVVDGTRPETANMAIQVHERVQSLFGTLPFVLALNKADLLSDWTDTENAVRDLASKAVIVIKTSAKTGHDVQSSFDALGASLVGAT